MTMKQHKLFPLILLLALLAGCAAPTTPLPPTSTSVPPTETLVPTQTPIPTATFTPTATPYPPLSSKGPYFAYLKGAPKEQRAIVFLDANAVGRKEILLPDDISQQMSDLNNLSPDGKWLAYYTGDPDVYLVYESFGIPEEGPYDLALNLYNLETKETKLVTPLLSEDFPSNFNKQMDIFKKTGLPSELQHLSDDYNLSTLYGTFLFGINSLSWSPDGRHLAFAGQMNGLSSDLYVYDMETQAIHQLSSGPEEIYWISWSPDGKGILHGSTYEAGMGMKCRNYIADLEGDSVRYLSENTLCNPPDLWIDNFTYFEYDNENVTGSYYLRSVNTRTGGIIRYWDGSFGPYAVDLKNRVIVMTATWDTIPRRSAFKEGLYLIDLDTRQTIRVIDGYYWNLEYFGLGGRNFVVLAGPRKDYFLKEDGTLVPIDGRYASIIVTPNKEYWIGVRDKISVFAKDDLLVRDIALPKDYCDQSNMRMITWSPDSSGFFFYCSEYKSDDTSYDLLYFVNLLNGDPILVESDWWSWYNWFSNYGWIPVQP
jgi:WD40 repeat protein